MWRAADEMLDRQVAVKEMRIDGLDAEDARTRRERTLREARATARIDHPNVVRVYDVVDEGERLWIVMELVTGPSLERMMVEDGPLSPRAAALLGLGLVEALRQVHARGVLHRDIKPGNVLVESSDRTGRRIVLTDFGIAAIQDAKALTMVGMLVGSPDYMAPERVSGRPQGPPSDIWSLGATLCAALGGRSPFSRDTTLATLHAVLYEEPELPATAGPLTDILAALLEKDPSVRPGLDDVEAALRAVAFPAATPTPTLRVGAGDGTGTPEPGVHLREADEVDEADEEREEGEDEESDAAEVTPPLPWAPRESHTPAYLDDRVVRAARDPRLPESGAVGETPVPERDGGGAEPEDAVPAGHAASDAPQEETRSAPAADVVDVADETPVAADVVGADVGGEQPRPPSVPHVASASTEAVSEERSEVRSEAPSGNSVGAVLRAGAPTTSTPVASAPTQDSLSAGAPTEHYPMPDAPTRDTPTRAASAPTRVGPIPGAARGSRPGVSLIRGRQAVPGQNPASNPASNPDPNSAPGDGAGPAPDPLDPRPDSGRDPEPAIPVPLPDPAAAPDPDSALLLGPHPLRMPPGELPGPALPATPRRGRRRRTALVAAASVLVAGAAVVGVLLANTSGSPGDDKAGGSPDASVSASASASRSGSSTGGSPSSPSSTVEGTSRPRSLPPGAHAEAGGFAWATPSGWRRDIRTGAEIHYTSPDAKQELVAKSSMARGDLMATWETSEQDAHRGRDYHKIRLEETTFQGHPAVVWEYTVTVGGVPWHAQLLGFNVGDKSYQVNTWYQPDIEASALRKYSKVKDSFTVL